METIVSPHIDQVVQLCRKFHVQRLEMFGSATSTLFDEARSDVDLLVEFATLPAGENADAYFGFLESLESLFGRSVDLVMIRAIRNPYFLQAIENSRTLLYAA